MDIDNIFWRCGGHSYSLASLRAMLSHAILVTLRDVHNHLQFEKCFFIFREIHNRCYQTKTNQGWLRLREINKDYKDTIRDESPLNNCRVKIQYKTKRLRANYARPVLCYIWRLFCGHVTTLSRSTKNSWNFVTELEKSRIDWRIHVSICAL